jgi:hypothetical protein
MEIAESPFISAPGFGVLVAEIRCHSCDSLTPTAAVWVPVYVEHADVDSSSRDRPALLCFVEWVQRSALVQICTFAPWLRLSSSGILDIKYLVHHCVNCDTVHDDQIIFSALGPYRQKGEAIRQNKRRFVRCVGSLAAQACPISSDLVHRSMFCQLKQ